jgi:hypothetical protein
MVVRCDRRTQEHHCAQNTNNRGGAAFASSSDRQENHCIRYDGKLHEIKEGGKTQGKGNRRKGKKEKKEGDSFVTTPSNDETQETTSILSPMTYDHFIRIEIDKADWSGSMIFRTFRDFDWIIRVTQDIFLVLRTNKDVDPIFGAPLLPAVSIVSAPQ